MTLNKYKKSLLTLSRVLILATSVALFAMTMLLWYRQASILAKANYIEIALYALLLFIFYKSYSCHRVGALRLKELVFSYALCLVITNVITYVQMCLIAGDVLHPWHMIVLTVTQGLICVGEYYMAHRLYFRFYPVREIVAIVSEGGTDADFILKFRENRNRYWVAETMSETAPMEQLEEAIDRHSAVVLGDLDPTLRNTLIRYCYERDKRLYVLPSVTDIMMNNAHEAQVMDTVAYLCKNRGLSHEHAMFKRGMDVLLSAMGLIVTSPLLLLTSAAIWLYDRGPVFYVQDRLTKGGRIFQVIKFRSMVVDAERDGARLASEYDERITPVGKVIRKLRIDELPQLWNVLKGDMSMVGPRPERPEIAAEYEKVMPEFRYRLKMKAGLTGYAQVYGKYNTTPQDKLKMDLLYIEQSSFILDIKLMLMTVKVIFTRDSTQGLQQGQRLPECTRTCARSCRPLAGDQKIKRMG
jgi:exopolysaccharide biosynthesis polyprenyl glycosylphosphotransferase